MVVVANILVIPPPEAPAPFVAEFDEIVQLLIVKTTEAPAATIAPPEPPDPVALLPVNMSRFNVMCVPLLARMAPALEAEQLEMVLSFRIR